ncbi:hypothetical protein ENUP19_0047G0040 [Entamoeba nuttalli]|uniref:Neuroguidin n=1 Tax=Entamoeba nuttalli TaxID=412467 RepID=A0ABQ0DAV4_9EUKA
MSEEQHDYELIEKMKALRENVDELANKINVLNMKLQQNPLKTQKGISFLDVKYSLLFEYNMYLAYYCWIKSSGSNVERHKAIERLFYLRILMERCKPIEKKLKYQIDKLLAETIADESLNAKPNVDDLVVEKNEDGIYKPTTIAGKAMEVEVNDVPDAKTFARHELEENVDDDIDAPEEIGFDGQVVVDKGQMEREKEIRKYEEQMHVRLNKKQKLTKVRDEFQELEDFVSNLKDDLVKEYRGNKLKGDIVDDNDSINSDEIESQGSDDNSDQSEVDDEEIDSDEI